MNGISAMMSNVESNLDRPLKVLVAGGGIGGLAAAIFLRQAGHTVEIFESSRFATETGAAIHIPSNVNGLLRRMGIIPEDHGANQCEYVSEYSPNGEQVFLKDVRMLAKVFPYPWQLIHRVDLHNALKDIATSTKGKGTPAVLHLRSKAINVDVKSTTLTLEDGTSHTGDLIIGADGVHSKIRAALIQNLTPPKSSGISAFRFLIPLETLKADPATADFILLTGEMRLLYGTDRRIVIYPCKNNTQLNFVAMHPDEESEANSEDWDQSASKETMLHVYRSFPEEVKAVLNKAVPEGINLWKLLDHDELGRENWVHGNIALLGDAAHAFLPHQGQGGAQAIEDAAAFGALFPLGTRPEDIPRRLELYLDARYDRASMIQEFSRQAAFKTTRGKHGGNKLMDPMKLTETNFNHDAFDYAQGILKREYQKTVTYHRFPLGFGPTPSPRQDLNGRPRTMGKHSYQTSFVTFKTPKSYLNTLLPSDEFAISAPGAWATATFSVTRLGNLDWLGGRGYSFFGLWIHDVTHDRVPTTPVEQGATACFKGDYLPVMFENMADPIITGREEIKFPKVFATLNEVASSPSSLKISAGWEGTEFCQLILDNLVESADAESVLQKAVLTSAVSSSGDSKSSVECFSSSPLPSQDGEKKWKAATAEIKFTELEGQELERAFPTLANIIRGLRAIKVVQVLNAGVQASA